MANYFQFVKGSIVKAKCRTNNREIYQNSIVNLVHVGLVLYNVITILT